MGTLEGLLTFHEFWPQGGAGGENQGHPKKASSFMITPSKDIRSVSHPYDPAFRVMRAG